MSKTRKVITDNGTPVLVLNCKLGGLAIMRSLGSQGVPLYGVDAERGSAGMLSRYCRGKYGKTYDERYPGEYLAFVMELGSLIGRDRILLIPTSDELSVFVAENAERLRERFVFPRNDPDLVKRLVSKKGMFELARRHGIPTANTLFPESIDEVRAYAANVQFPVMLKGIHGNRLQLRTGKKMLIVHSGQDLIESYDKLEDPSDPNLMIQEYIPGGDDQIHIFNGYFDEKSDCLAAYTGHKIRQYPIHVGCASLGACIWNQEVADITIRFMKDLGYTGILDIGYRWDPRDRTYKVLDVNPRVGQAFRLFVSRGGMDVVRALYLDQCGHKVPEDPPVEGRKWVIEDYDLESSMDYFREGTLSFGQWVKSFNGVEEGAWFNRKDPYPFAVMCKSLLKRMGSSILRKIGRSRERPV